MLAEKHDILHEFPELKKRIELLKKQDKKFAKMMDEHDHLDEEIRDIETMHQPVADNFIEDMKKKRLALKDDLYDQLKDPET